MNHPEELKKFQLEEKFEYKCKYHNNIRAEFKCPICSSLICKECFKILKIKDLIAYKGICKSCNLRLNIKISVFLLILLYFIYRIILLS